MLIHIIVLPGVLFFNPYPKGRII